MVMPGAEAIAISIRIGPCLRGLLSFRSMNDRNGFTDPLICMYVG